jgi:hypothetical protein
MASWEERHAGGDEELYHCECADPECRVKLPVRKLDYEQTRQDAALFLVAPGHETPDVESLIEEHGSWSVVRKDPDVQSIVEKTDPRS